MERTTNRRYGAAAKELPHDKGLYASDPRNRHGNCPNDREWYVNGLNGMVGFKSSGSLIFTLRSQY